MCSPILRVGHPTARLKPESSLMPDLSFRPARRPLIRERLVRRAALAAALSIALTIGGAVSADAAVPTSSIRVSCATALPAATQRLVFGAPLKPEYSTPSTSRPTGIIDAAIREAGYRDCGWARGAQSARVEALPAADRSFAHYRPILIRSGSRMTRSSVISCFASDPGTFCTVDVLTHHVWAEAGITLRTGSVRAAYTAASRVLPALRHAYRHGAAGAAWKRPKTAWSVPSSCAAFDPTDAVGRAAGLGGGDVEQGDTASLDSPVSGEVFGKVGYRICDWWAADPTQGTINIAFLPGATWAHPRGTTVPAASIGKHVLRATRQSENGGPVLDVVTTGGWFEISYGSTLGAERAAAKAALALLY